MFIQRYCDDKAVEYAKQHAMNYNPQFPDYSNSGGDCMNFISQCLNAGNVPMKHYGGYAWYANTSSSSKAWHGVDSFLAYLRCTFANPHIWYECLSTPKDLVAGDIVFTVGDGDAGDTGRNPSHIVMLSQDYATQDKLIVCGHTVNQLDAEKPRKDRLCMYIHILGIVFEFKDSDYVDTIDKLTAQVDLGSNTLRPSNKVQNYVKRLQERLNYLGYSAGTVDGKFGDNTSNAVKAFQRACQKKFGLAIDGLVGRDTKEALLYPKGWHR